MSRTKVISVRMPVGLVEDLEALAEHLNIHRNDLIIEGVKLVIQKYLNNIRIQAQVNVKPSTQQPKIQQPKQPTLPNPLDEINRLFKL